MREDVSFTSGGLRCAAWLYRAQGNGNTPLIVMAHGLGATRELGLDPFARRFCEAGLSALVFDYRHYGESEGTPRELLSVHRQLEDWRAAVAFAKTLPGIDRERITAWGSSFSGGHVMRIASEGHGLAAAVSQVPFSSGLASARAVPPRTVLRLTSAAVVDGVKSALGRGPHYVPLIAPPPQVALLSDANSYEGFRKLLPPGLEESGLWRNRATARTALAIVFYEPGRRAARIRIPILFVVADRDAIAPAAAAVKAAHLAPRGELLRYPEGHFDYYQGDGFERIVTDELAFLKKHLLGGEARTQAA